MRGKVYADEGGKIDYEGYYRREVRESRSKIMNKNINIFAIITFPEPHKTVRW